MPGCKVGDLAIVLYDPHVYAVNPECVGAFVKILAQVTPYKTSRFPSPHFKVKAAHPVFRPLAGGLVNITSPVSDYLLQPIRPSQTEISKHHLHRFRNMYS